MIKKTLSEKSTCHPAWGPGGLNLSEVRETAGLRRGPHLSGCVTRFSGAQSPPLHKRM